MSAPRPVVAFIAGGGPGSAMAERARSFADRLAGEFDARPIHARGRRAGAVAGLLRELVAARPALCYVLDVAAAGVAAAGVYRSLTRTPLVVDTGDAVVELGRALGRGPVGVLATRELERFAFGAAAGVVVRGSYHRDLLARRGIRAEFVPDGVAVDQFAPPPAAPGRPSGRPLTIGLVGSSVWSPVRRTCYGMDLVDLIGHLKDRLPGHPVRGIMIGDGSGVDRLHRRAAEHGIADRVEFAGRVPYRELPAWLHRCDICLSTQTDDVIGNVRTTGKLPLYLAAGCFVLASRVGEAARILPPEMLVEFRGASDPEYPARLADRVADLVAAGTDFARRPDCVALARAHFEYDRLAPRVAAVIRGGVESRRGRPR